MKAAVSYGIESIRSKLSQWQTNKEPKSCFYAVLILPLGGLCADAALGSLFSTSYSILILTFILPQPPEEVDSETC